METQKTEFDGTLWFFSGLSTGKISEIDWNPEVNLSYSDGSHNKYVSVSGTAEIVDDLRLGTLGLGVPDVLSQGVVGDGGAVAVTPLGDAQVHAYEACI